MSNNKDDEKSSGFGPKTSCPKGTKRRRGWATAFKRIMHYARISRNGCA